MNVARSTFMRRGCPLTALAVAVLLAGFSGTAWAQTTTTTTTASSRFTSSSGTLDEGATTSVDTAKPLKVTIRRSTRSKADPYNTSSSGAHLRLAFEYNGVDYVPTSPAHFSVAAGPPDETPTDLTITNAGTVDLTFGQSGETRVEVEDEAAVAIRNDEIELTITDAADPANWIPEKLVITLTNHPNLSTSEVTVRDFTSKFTVTITDDDLTPKFKFDKPDIQLAKGNMQMVTVGLGVGEDGSGVLPTAIRNQLETLTSDNDSVLFSVSPRDAVGKTILIMDNADTPAQLMPDGQGRYNIGNIMDAVSGNHSECRGERCIWVQR